MCAGFDRKIQVSLLNSTQQFFRVSDLFLSRCNERRQRAIRNRIISGVCFHGLQYARRSSRGGTSQPRKMASACLNAQRRTRKDGRRGLADRTKKTAIETTTEADTSSSDWWSSQQESNRSAGPTPHYTRYRRESIGSMPFLWLRSLQRREWSHPALPPDSSRGDPDGSSRRREHPNCSPAT